MAKNNPTNKKAFIIRTRWEYYGAAVGGGLAMIGLGTFFMVLAFDDNEFSLGPFLIALVLVVGLLQGFISFFSSMKTVEVTSKGLVITYMFQKHQNTINFSDVVKLKTRRTDKETVIFPRTINDTFTLELADGRSFSFGRSQFDFYGKLKEVCLRECRRP